MEILASLITADFSQKVQAAQKLAAGLGISFQTVFNPRRSNY